ncbi:cell division protein FtsZ [Candidatus Microgenomates bacterium]|nr:cell division protein FtsZ [Candidatus Microgenomates bacterium]
MLIKPDLTRFAKLKVIGVGGGGGNAIASMINSGSIQGVDFVAVNTDAQVLLANPAPTKIQIGESLTRGLGSGGDPEMGKKAAEESAKKIEEKIADADMIFIAAGMGGGTGTGASGIIADIAKKCGVLTVGVVTKPFAFEGTQRLVIAEEGVVELKDKVDALIVIPNQRIIEIVDKKVTLLEAFRMADSVLTASVQGISDLIVMPGLVNRDFADVKSIMQNAGSALMGIGSGSGENRAGTAARQAISSPLLELTIDGAKGVLFNIIGGPDLTMQEVDEASKIIAAAADADAKIIFGATIDEAMVDQVKITVIATGFDENRQRLKQLRFERPGTTPSAYTGPVGIVSDPTSSATDPVPPPTEPPPPTDESPKLSPDEFGEEFEIPAFLRKGK